MTHVRGTCHCGAVELQVTLPDGLASARRCDCSFCRRRGAIVVSASLDQLVIVRGAQNLTLYQWGTGTAKHWFARPAAFTPTISDDQTRCSTASIRAFLTASVRAILALCP